MVLLSDGPIKLFGVYFTLCPHMAPERAAQLVTGTAPSRQLARSLQLRQTTVGAILFRAINHKANLLVSILCLLFLLFLYSVDCLVGVGLTDSQRGPEEQLQISRKESLNCLDLGGPPLHKSPTLSVMIQAS